MESWTQMGNVARNWYFWEYPRWSNQLKKQIIWEKEWFLKNLTVDDLKLCYLFATILCVWVSSVSNSNFILVVHIYLNFLFNSHFKMLFSFIAASFTKYGTPSHMKADYVLEYESF